MSTRSVATELLPERDYFKSLRGVLSGGDRPRVSNGQPSWPGACERRRLVM
jgi:hypothetical protein